MNYTDDYLKLIIECGKLIESGIVIGDTKMPFTMIDFYNLAVKNQLENVDHRYVRAIAYKYRNSYGISNRYLSRFMSFIDKENITGTEVNNALEIINQKYSFTFNDKKYVPTYEDIFMIMNIFDVYGVPKHDKLIYQALHRVARDFPIFPLLLSEEEKKLGR